MDEQGFESPTSPYASSSSQMWRKRKTDDPPHPPTPHPKKARTDTMEQLTSGSSSWGCPPAIDQPDFSPSSNSSSSSPLPHFPKSCAWFLEEGDGTKRQVKSPPNSPEWNSVEDDGTVKETPYSPASPYGSLSFPSTSSTTTTSHSTVEGKGYKKAQPKRNTKRGVHKQIGKNREVKLMVDKMLNDWLQTTHSCYWENEDEAMKADASMYRYTRRCRKEVRHLIGTKSKGKRRGKVCNLVALRKYKQQLEKNKTQEELAKLCYYCSSMFESTQEKEAHVDYFHNTCDLKADCKEKSFSCVWFREVHILGRNYDEGMKRKNMLGHVDFKCLNGYSGQMRWPKKITQEQDADYYAGKKTIRSFKSKQMTVTIILQVGQEQLTRLSLEEDA